MLIFEKVLGDIRCHYIGDCQQGNVISDYSLYIFKFDDGLQRWYLDHGKHGGLSSDQEHIEAIRSKLNTISYTFN